MKRTMLRLTLTALVTVTLLAAPAAAAAPERAADAQRSGWAIDVGELLSRAWGMLVGARVGERGAGERAAGKDGGRIARMTAADDGRNAWDPDG